MRIFVNIKPCMQAVQHNPSIIQKAEERQWVQQPGHCCEVIENKKQIQKRKKKTPQHFLLSCSQTFKAFLTESLAPLPSYKDGRYCTIDPISHLLRLSCYHKCRYVFQNVCKTKPWLRVFERQFDSERTLKKSVKSCTSAVDVDDAKAAAVPRPSLIDTVHGFSTGSVWSGATVGIGRKGR